VEVIDVTQADPQMKIRLPPAVKDWIVQRSAQNRRTMNGEIVFRLEAAMAAEQAGRPADGASAAGRSLAA
jgi:hypothetical protein